MHVWAKTWSTNRTIADTPAQQRTRFMTNSEALAGKLSTQCDKRHKHQVLLDGRAKDAAKYPKGLCDAICSGLKADMQQRCMRLTSLGTVGPTDKIQHSGYMHSLDGRR